MRILKMFIIPVFITAVIFLLSACQLPADKYETVSITIHGKKLLGTGPYKKAVDGKVIGIEDSCCIYDYRKIPFEKVIDKKEELKYPNTPKNITLKTNGKIITYKIHRKAKIFRNGIPVESLSYAAATDTDTIFRNRIKDVYVDAYLLLDSKQNVRRIETFFIYGFAFGIKEINHKKGFIVLQQTLYPVDDDMALYDFGHAKRLKQKGVKILKPSENKDRFFKEDLMKNCLINKNYQRVSLSALKELSYADIFYNMYGKAKRIDMFKSDFRMGGRPLYDPAPEKPAGGYKMKPLSYNGKLYNVTPETKAFHYGWPVAFSELPYYFYVWYGSTIGITVDESTNTVKSIVIWDDPE